MYSQAGDYSVGDFNWVKFQGRVSVRLYMGKILQTNKTINKVYSAFLC